MLYVSRNVCHYNKYLNTVKMDNIFYEHLLHCVTLYTQAKLSGQPHIERVES